MTDTTSPRTLGVILARTGSKGLPNKNTLLVAGRPMLTWTFEHALGSRTLDQIVLSTDGQDLAELARAHGIGTIARPAALANDTATIDAAARHAVEQVEREQGVRLDAVAVLYGNVPVRPTDLTDRAMTKLLETGCDSVQSVYPVGKNHPYWMKRLGGDAGDTLEMYEPNTVYRRQDLPPTYMLDGGVIAVTRTSLFTIEVGQPHAFLGKDRRAVVTQAGEVTDVDDEVDLRVAEAILELRAERAKVSGSEFRVSS